MGGGGGGGGCLKASIKLEVLLRLRPCKAQNVFTIIFSVVRALMAAWCFPLPCYCFLVLCHVFSQHLDCAVSMCYIVSQGCAYRCTRYQSVMWGGGGGGGGLPLMLFTPTYTNMRINQKWGEKNSWLIQPMWSFVSH